MIGEFPDELPPGFEFGGYTIHACIGRGGMAHVYRAEHTALHRLVALKVLDRWVLERPSGKQRFLQEARTIASVKHPNVVDIIDVGVWHERPYIVMELLTGHDLDSHLDRFDELSEIELVRLALPLIAGLMAVHDAGVVHRDLKPSNFFLADGPDGEIIPKLLDFGISKFSNGFDEPLGSLTNTREIIGTPAYMAPEGLNGMRELSPAADQYSLGAVLYECAVGRPPFEGETLLELLKAIAVGSIEPPSALRPDISPVLEGIILRATRSDPKARFETLREMGRALWPLADTRTRTIWERSFGTDQISVASRSDEVALNPHGESGNWKVTLPRWRAHLSRSGIRRVSALVALTAVMAAGAALVWDSDISPVDDVGPPTAVLPLADDSATLPHLAVPSRAESQRPTAAASERPVAPPRSTFEPSRRRHSPVEKQPPARKSSVLPSTAAPTSDEIQHRDDHSEPSAGRSEAFEWGSAAFTTIYEVGQDQTVSVRLLVSRAQQLDQVKSMLRGYTNATALTVASRMTARLVGPGFRNHGLRPGASKQSRMADRRTGPGF